MYRAVLEGNIGNSEPGYRISNQWKISAVITSANKAAQYAIRRNTSTNGGDLKRFIVAPPPGQNLEFLRRYKMTSTGQTRP
jgi:hypothetical protein